MINLNVLIDPSVILKIFDTTINLQNETAGYLTGYLEEDNLIIKDVAIPVQESSRVSVKLESNVLMETVNQLVRYKPGEIICGWFHTHPGMGADFMSQTDIKTQTVYQKLFPEAVALVVDPLEYRLKSDLDNRTLSLYRVEAGKPVELDFKTTLTGREILKLALKHLEYEKPIHQHHSQADRLVEFSDLLKESRQKLLTAILAWNLIVVLIVLTVLTIILF